MTFEDWSATIKSELAAAGFVVKDYKGFPLVERPEAMADGVRLLELKMSLPADRRIYAEGMLFIPPQECTP